MLVSFLNHGSKQNRRPVNIFQKQRSRKSAVHMGRHWPITRKKDLNLDSLLYLGLQGQWWLCMMCRCGLVPHTGCELPDHWIPHPGESCRCLPLQRDISKICFDFAHLIVEMSRLPSRAPQVNCLFFMTLRIDLQQPNMTWPAHVNSQSHQKVRSETKCSLLVFYLCRLSPVLFPSIFLLPSLISDWPFQTKNDADCPLCPCCCFLLCDWLPCDALCVLCASWRWGLTWCHFEAEGSHTSLWCCHTPLSCTESVQWHCRCLSKWPRKQHEFHLILEHSENFFGAIAKKLEFECFAAAWQSE